MDRETKLRLLAAYQLHFISKAAVVLYGLFGRGQVDVKKFEEVYETSSLFRHHRGAHRCYRTTIPFFEISVCVDLLKIWNITFAEHFLLDGGRLKEEEAAKIESLLDKVVPTRDLAKIAEYQLFEYDAVALLTFALFGLGPVDVRRLEDEAAQRLGISRFSAQYIISRITEQRNGKYYLDDSYAKRIVEMSEIVDDLLSTREGARQRRGLASLIEKIRNFGRPQEPSKKMKLAIEIYKRYGEEAFDPEELYSHVRDLYQDKTEYYLHVAELSWRYFGKRHLRYKYVEAVKQYLREEERRRKRIGARLARLFS